MSKRAIEAAIISIAQQARPNCRGQTELLRPQLTNSSMLESRMPWRLSSSRSASLMPAGSVVVKSLMLFPFEMAAMPGPDESFGQEQDEHEHRDQCAGRQPGEADRKRQ